MIQLKVNGVEQSFGGTPEMPLLWYLRDVLGLTGSKFGCGVGLCGACTVHVNGQATRSCVTPMRDAAGKEVTTIEGLDKNGLHPVQKAWMQINVPQCGYCQVGQIMQAAALLNSKRNLGITKSMRPCPGTSAAAERISVFALRLKQRPREWHELD
jgi:isoquinoline 1-oxidoreductase alpha subunit